MIAGIPPDIVVFIGLPGCGKSTLGQMLAAKTKFNLYEMSVLIDDELERLTKRAYLIFDAIDKEVEHQRQLKKGGYNCENDFVCKLAIEKLLGYSGGIIICGFPRDEEQAQRFVDFTKNAGMRNRILAILPKISDTRSIETMKKKLSQAEQEMNVPELIHLRFENIKKDFNKVISVLGRSGISTLKIDAMQEPQQAFGEILKHIVGS